MTLPPSGSASGLPPVRPPPSVGGGAAVPDTPSDRSSSPGGDPADSGAPTDVSGMQLFDRYADRLHDLVLFLTRDPAAAAEVTRDVIIQAVSRRGDSRASEGHVGVGTRAWLYARARAEAFSQLSARGRMPSEDRVVDVPELPEPTTKADLAQLVWSVTSAFSERDQALLTLYLRHGLAGGELADALGVSRGAVQMLLPATLDRVSAQLGVLMLLATGRTDQYPCEGLVELAAEWDGTFSPYVRRRTIELDVECGDMWQIHEDSALDLLRDVPLAPAPAALRGAVAERLKVNRALSPGGEVEESTEDDQTLSPGVVPVVVVPGDATVPAAATGQQTSAEQVPAATDATEQLASPDVADTRASEISVRPEADLVGPLAGGEGPLPKPPVRGPQSRVLTDIHTEGQDGNGGPGSASRQGNSLNRALIGLAVLALILVVAATVYRVASDNTSTTVAASPTPSATLSAPGSAITGASAAESALPLTTPPLTPPPATATPATATQSDRPGALTVPGGIQQIPSTGSAAALRLTNPGGKTVQWQAVAKPSWLRLDQNTGTIDPGTTIEVAGQMAPDLREGDYEGTVVLQWNGGDSGIVEVSVIGSVEVPPRLLSVQIGAMELFPTDCGLDRTEVAIVVEEQSALARVTVSVTGPRPNSLTEVSLEPDAATPGRFVGILGPFADPGTVSLSLSATDERGNGATASSPGLEIVSCPQQ